MGTPTLVLVDLQQDFYAPGGSYDRAGRPLKPIRKMIQRLVPFCAAYPRVVRIQSLYDPDQFSDMPRLCSQGSPGADWHPQLRKGPLLTKRDHSGFPALEKYFDQPAEIILAGVCTHRCIQQTFVDALEHGWDVQILEEGVASCGKRWNRHRACLSKWTNQDRTISIPVLSEHLNKQPGPHKTPNRTARSVARTP